MPDQFGNMTEQEVIQQLQIQRMMERQTERTPQERREGRLRAFGRAISSKVDPRITIAQDIEEAMSKAARLPRTEGETNLDYQIRQGRQAMSDMQNVDPMATAALSAQVTELEMERFTRSKLTAEASRAEARDSVRRQPPPRCVDQRCH